MSAQKQVRGITPILQARLLAETDKVCDALDDNDLDRAYRCLKTLITICPPEVQDKGIIEELNELDDAILKAKKTTDVDETTRRRARGRAIMRVYAERVRPLFWKTFRALYDGNYLALYARDVESNIPKKMLLDKTQ